MLTANEVGGVEGDDESIEKCGKLLKIGKLFKSKNPHLTSATEEHNFLTSHAKTDFKF